MLKTISGKYFGACKTRKSTSTLVKLKTSLWASGLAKVKLMSKDYTFHYLGIVFPSWPFLLHGIALDTVNCLSLAVTMVTPLFAKNRVTFGQPRTTYPKYRDICVCVSVCKRKVEKHIETSSETKS